MRGVFGEIFLAGLILLIAVAYTSKFYLALKHGEIQDPQNHKEVMGKFRYALSLLFYALMMLSCYSLIAIYFYIEFYK